VFSSTRSTASLRAVVYVALDASVKFTVLKVRNECGRSRRLSVTGYVEWVLGDLRAKSAMHVITEVDPGSGALFARNPYHTEFGGRVAFFNVDDATRTVSGDRTEFIGRNGTLRSPVAMTRSQLSGKVGAALDPCAAIQVPFEIADGQEREFIFTLAQGETPRRPATWRIASGDLLRHGARSKRCGSIGSTLSGRAGGNTGPSLDVLTNGWLLYQTLACRLWARSGTYQPGGAFGSAISCRT